MSYICIDCNKTFMTNAGLNGHKRIHGISQGKINQILCSSLLTKQIVSIKNLEKHEHQFLAAFRFCKKCDKSFTSKFDSIFCSKSCSVSFTNSISPKRKKKVVTLQSVKSKKVRTEKELKAKRVQRVQAYRAKKYGSTPKDVDRKLLNKIYENCPEGYEVDHIIALAEGGKHEPENLQYLPALENRRKNKTQNYNRSLVIHWQDMIVNT